MFSIFSSDPFCCDPPCEILTRVSADPSQSSIADLHFPSAVLSVRINRERLVAVLERRVIVHVLATLQVCGQTEPPRAHPAPLWAARAVVGGNS